MLLQENNEQWGAVMLPDVTWSYCSHTEVLFLLYVSNLPVLPMVYL